MEIECLSLRDGDAETLSPMGQTLDKDLGGGLCGVDQVVSVA